MSKKLLQTRNSLRVNKDAISTQNVRDKEHIIVKGMTHMILDATMNGIFYPRAEVEKLASNIANERITMPASHPTGENGEFISASDPWALTSNYVGAYAYNFSIQADKLISDLAIDPMIANTSEQGKQIVEAIQNGEAIDVSTGFYLNIEEVTGYGKDGEPYQAVASNIHIDHSAFLPNETGAKNKLESVGIHTNSARVKDEMLDTHIAELTANASTPAMNLPLAPDTHVWSESMATQRIQDYTDSVNAPSSNYRKFFLEFDQDMADSFSAYKYPFADIIDGVPHAIKNPIMSMQETNEHAAAYMEKFNAERKTDASFFNKLVTKCKSLFMGNESSHDAIREQLYKKINEGMSENEYAYPIEVFDSYFVYRDSNDKLYEQRYSLIDDAVYLQDVAQEVERVTEYKPVFNNNSKDSIMEKAKLIALLAANGITANADMSDADLEAALNTALSDKPAETVVDTATNDKIDALTATVNLLAATVTANTDEKLNEAVASVVALNKGIDEATAKTMGLASCNAFLAANGHVAFNAQAAQHQQNAKDGCSSLALPSGEH